MALNTKFLVPAALGFSLVTVTAFVVYYVFKKEEEADDKPIRSTKINMIEVKVSKSIVPALIGRAGSNIKQIEEKSGATIHFKKFSEKDYDVCIIRGRTHATQIAETLVHDFIKQQPLIEDDYMPVPGWACGRIIGSGGETINLISHRSGARVKVEGQRGDLSAQRQISLRGTVEQIEMAKKLIAECVETERCRREIDQTRTPRVPTPPAAQTGLPTELPAAQPERPDTPGDLAKHVKYRREATTSSIEVYVSAVSSPSRFWVQFVGPQVGQLDELVEHMTEYYNNKENRANHALSQVCVGQVVAAVFRHDGRWYRARVNDLRPNEFDHTQQVADVFFLDYGDSEYVATHELCELRADLLRLRFQAMECFLAGVDPAPQPGDSAPTTRWHPHAVERFEELTQVAKWKPLVSRTCTYKKSAAAGGNEKEVPGIKLYDVTDAGGSVDVSEVLLSEGWARRAIGGGGTSHAHAHGAQPYGDLGHSRVLGMVTSLRASSMPADRKDDATPSEGTNKDNLMASKSLSSGLETADKIKSISNFDLSYSETTQPKVNGSHDFIASEKQNNENEVKGTPKTLSVIDSQELKANMNRIDSHHSNLDSLGRFDSHK